MSKWARVVGTAALFLLFVTAAPGHAQHRGGGDKGGPQAHQQGGGSGKQDGGGKQHATTRQPSRPQAQATAGGGDRAVARPQSQTRSVSGGSKRPAPPRPANAGTAQPRASVAYPSMARSKSTARDWQKQRGWQGQGAWAEHPTWRGHRAVRWEHDHRTWKQRGGYGGYFVPASHFHLYFGPAHYFRIRTRPVIVMGYPRFYYRGYWFMLVDPWPEFWADTWYADDDVYVDYDDGYYLHNRRHPGVSVAISVVL